MQNQGEFDFFIENMIDKAAREFAATEQYRLLNEKLGQMYRDCDNMFREEEKEFAMECFDLLIDVGGKEETYIYRKGLSDSVSFLKWLGVLA